MQMKKENLLRASCAAGLENLVADEIEAFGGKDIVRAKGVVLWRGDLASGYRACLWSRFSSRIFLQIDEFFAPDNESIYKECSGIEWENHLDCDTTFAVDCTLSDNSMIRHSKFASLRVKDAIVDRFRSNTGRRPSVKTERPGIRINIHIQKDKAFLSLDLSGESLHRRGYREATGTAPLKETLAAAIVSLAGWKEGNAATALLDPMCGSGTLLIEAALIYGDSAPGLSRSYFGFNAWKGHDKAIWNQLVDEAVLREEAGFEKKWPVILGYDADPLVVAAARKNIVRAGLEEKIRVGQAELAVLKNPGTTGLVVCNPPYGERQSEKTEVAQLYRGLGHILRERFAGWRAGIFISNPDWADAIGLQREGSYKLFNGPLVCRLFIGSVTPSPEDFSLIYREGSSLTAGMEGADFANRLIKNLRNLLGWAKRNSISCFRVYDRDIPEYNVSVDIYDKWFYVQEYSPPASITADAATRRLHLVLAIIREIFEVKKERIFIKTRRRQKGRGQYEKKESHGKLHEVREGGCRFLVNLSDYIDTGLFLDHRPLRKKIAKESKGKKFLNLFGYTGTATVFAARGGAASTTTVDLSNTYLHWTRLNLALNGFSNLHHEIVRADCVEWIRGTEKKFDLIFLDPPTFSNTKKAGRVFDVQRDHGQLITLAMARLERGGLLLFSTNFRKFTLDDALLKNFEIVEISDRTIPLDYKRNTKIHRCWEIRKSIKIRLC